MNTRAYLTVVCLIALFSSSCEQPRKSKHIDLREAQNKVVQTLKDENALNVVIYPFDNSLWIYAPLEEEFFKYTAKKEGPITSNESENAFSINFLNANYSNRAFNIEYDISNTQKYKIDPGYSSGYTEFFSNAQRHILTALYRIYGNFEKFPSDGRFYAKAAGDKAGRESSNSHKELVHAYLSTEQAPNIFVIVLANIKLGLEIKMMVTLEDLKRGSSDQSFGEEYQKRFVAEPITGHTNIINDIKGEHLNAHDVSWNEFIAKQIVTRSRFQYQQSQHKPSTNTANEIVMQAKQSIEAYQFKDFDSINLHNLRDNTTTSISRQELSTMEIKKPSESEGKFHIIEFR